MDCYTMKQLTLLFVMLLNMLIASNGYTENRSDQFEAPDSKSEKGSNPLTALNTLIKRRQFKQAYSLAHSFVEDLEGEPGFDFLYGMAAIETAHYDAALFAFERLLLLYPNQARYRLELARIHFYLRNLSRAEVEFQKILKQNPPDTVKRNVQLFLDSIADLSRMVKPRRSFSVDMAGGWDSNINSATDDSFLPKEELTFPVDIVLNDDGRETGSSFFSALLNFNYLSPISKTTSYDVRATYTKRTNSKVDTFNLDTAMFEAGYGFYTGAIKWRAAGRYQLVNLDNESFLNSASGIGQATWLFKSGANLNLAVNYGYSHYDSKPNGDITQQQFNLTYSSAIKNENWFLSFLYASDSADDDSNRYSGKKSQGLTYYRSSLLNQRTSQYWMFNISSSEHSAINTAAFYNKLRKDILATVGIGWRYSFNTNFSIRNDYSATVSDSTLVANSYDRFKAEFGLTYNF
jgi:tetratricopeptide (TPR) repeat protein